MEYLFVYAIIFVFGFILTCFAINNLTDILTSIDFFILSTFRQWFQDTFPKLGKIVICKYCQSFWLSGLICCYASFSMLGLGVLSSIVSIILWLSMHSIIQLIDEFRQRYLDRVLLPQNHNVILISEDLNNTEKPTIPENTQVIQEGNPD